MVNYELHKNIQNYFFYLQFLKKVYYFVKKFMIY